MSAAVQVLIVCVGLVERDTSLPASERHAITQRYIQRARELHREAVQRSAGDPDLQDMLAWQLATTQQEWLRDPAQAVGLAQQAVARRPMEGGFWTTLGLARYRAGDCSAAIQALAEAVRLGNGGTPRDWLYLALAHERMGEREEARRWYERACAEQERDAAGGEELKQLRAEAAALFAAPAKPD